MAPLHVRIFRKFHKTINKTIPSKNASKSCEGYLRFEPGAAGKYMPIGEVVTLPYNSPLIKFPMRLNVYPSGITGTNKSVISQKLNPVFRAKYQTETSTPINPPWKDIPEIPVKVMPFAKLKGRNTSRGCLM